MNEFSNRIKTLRQKYENRIAQTVRQTVLGVNEVLVENSPWGDWPAWTEASKSLRPSPPYQPGLFKGSWDYGYGVIPEMPTPKVDSTGRASIARVKGKVGGSAGWDIGIAAEKHYLVNNTRYANLMETGVNLVGHNVQLGHMVAIASLSFSNVVREAVRRSA